MYLLSTLILFLPLLLSFSPASLVHGDPTTTAPDPKATTSIVPTVAPTSTKPSLSDVCKSIGNIQLFCKALGSGAGGGPGPSTHSGSSTSSSTLFAPTDPAGPTRLKALLARQNLLSSQDLYQISPYLIDAAAMRDLTGSTIQTLDNSSTLLNGRSQVVLSHGQRDSANASQALCGAPSPIHLFSGGGDNVTIIKEDVYFDGGVLHVTDNYFTLPDTLSATLSNESDTTIFASYLTNNASLDATPSITVFVPDNAAFLTSTSNQTLSPSAIASLINAYVVEGFVAYSPILTEGLQLRTVSGADVRISTQPDGSIYVNDVAKIIKADIVLENGVAHVIDELYFSGLLQATSPTPTPSLPAFTGAAGWSALDPTQTRWTSALAWSVFLSVAVAVGGSMIVIF